MQENCDRSHLILQKERASYEDSIIRTKNTILAIEIFLTRKASDDTKRIQDIWNESCESESQHFKKKIENIMSEIEFFRRKFDYFCAKIFTESSVVVERERIEFNKEKIWMEDNYCRKFSKLIKDESVKRSILLSKGKDMMKETKNQNKSLLQKIESQSIEKIDSMSQKYNFYRERQKEYEEQANIKFDSYKQRLRILTNEHNKMSCENDNLRTKYEKLEREYKNSQCDLDRLKWKIATRSQSNLEDQFENLQGEFNNIFEENRRLKRQKTTFSESFSYHQITSSPLQLDNFDIVGTSQLHIDGGDDNMSSAIISQLRSEYENSISTLIDEKRELVMRNSSAITDIQREKQKTLKLEKEIQRLQSEKTSIQLQLERSEVSKCGTLIHQVENNAKDTSFL